MKGGLALLLLVVVVGLAECMPSNNLKDRLQARVAALRTKENGEGKEGQEGKGKGKDTDWPYGWMEFLSLVGKCEANRNWLEILEMDQSEDSVLYHACPEAYKAAEGMDGATDEELKEVSKCLREYFPLLQCSNLQADKEALAVALLVNGKDITKDIYMKETEEVFEICYKVFEDAEAMEKKLTEDLKKVKEIEGAGDATRDAKIKNLLRQLINAAKKR